MLHVYLLHLLQTYTPMTYIYTSIWTAPRWFTHLPLAIQLGCYRGYSPLIASYLVVLTQYYSSMHGYLGQVCPDWCYNSLASRELLKFGSVTSCHFHLWPANATAKAASTSGNGFLEGNFGKVTVVFWVEVSNSLYFHLYLGKWSNLTHMFPFFLETTTYSFVLFAFAPQTLWSLTEPR